MVEINRSLLNTYLPRNKSLKILDAGCGPGAMLPTLSKYGDVIGVDMSEDALKYAKKRGKVLKGNIMDLKFKNGTFDLVVCMDVLYHTWVSDESKALNEFRRVLKKGGILLIREPAYNWMRGQEDVGSLTQRRFSRGKLQQLVEKSSFKILKMTYANFFLFPIVLLLRVQSSIAPEKTRGSSDFVLPAKPINNILLGILKIEAYLMNYVSLPFGSSLFCVAEKK